MAVSNPVLQVHPRAASSVRCWQTCSCTMFSTGGWIVNCRIFRPRLTKWPNGTYGVSFLPAASNAALKAIRREIRQWGLQRRSDKSLDDLARMFGSKIQGWINYYSHFYKSALYPTLTRIDVNLLRWARRKFKSLRQRPRQARIWLAKIQQRSPGLFPHWQ